MTPQSQAIEFPAPGIVPYRGGCVTEPALFALDYLVHWRANVAVRGVVHEDVPVLAFLRDVERAPEAFGVTAAEARVARERFLDGAGQALEAEGGQRAWLAKEFGL
ncbi:hypothetical protein [Deinococcus maricopensis]|uniref:Uncharacterized protein n=1 Tax=Deinococcus maricopensis (strain DSM 21211 / LMG 22137 / NRRL B-23946 / LB-34) TaxID=709986 RepID=E8U8G7_DEIML|nr:hypothetical protein [Deinococcus maricopensis]ADV67356.1 hypothetical protein Deima_1707 [Deinococcus maricopensis DSM 21211]